MAWPSGSVQNISTTKKSGLLMKSSLPRDDLRAKFTWPDLDTYLTLIIDYNARSLQRDTDALAAFAGLTVAVSHHFPSGFLLGLPKLYYDNALLWQPQNTLCRRSENDAQSEFPSWSWLGWQGILDASVCMQGIRDPRMRLDSAQPEGLTVRIFPITQWYKSTSKTGGQVRINSQYNSYCRLHVSYPPGWEDHEFPF
ncbi:hypothetical protein DE146DRAFT_764262 [Phaeosphaeria sp. MPI-PUGE-AT-0046c]|nr:hypothetical protein DE146DRAFT_764262 [Phaeosphaeria sp. MPI-PUGE-AT-0046c]